MKPLVSIIMSVYNSSSYLDQSINSILDQSYKNFEFIIVNDGSTDSSKAIVNRYKKKDPRIVLINNQTNIGLSSSLNKAINKAKGKYTLRMDADDISLADRIKIQVEYMEKNPDIGICGTWFKMFDNKRIHKICLPIQDIKIRSSMFFYNPLAHPTLIFRTSVLRENKINYSTKLRYAQDYQLWLDLSSRIKFHIIPKILLNYRITPNSLSTNNGMQKDIKTIHSCLLKRYGIAPTKPILEIHKLIGDTFQSQDEAQIAGLAKRLPEINDYFSLIQGKNSIGLNIKRTLLLYKWLIHIYSIHPIFITAGRLLRKINTYYYEHTSYC